MNARFTDFLGETLTALEQECPDAYEAMCRHLGDLEIHIEVDGAVTSVVGDSREIAISSASASPRVRIVSTRRTVLDLIDRKATLLTAVRLGELRWTGASVDVSAFLEAFSAYLTGAVRSPSFRKLLDAYRGVPQGSWTRARPDSRSPATVRSR